MPVSFFASVLDYASKDEQLRQVFFRLCARGSAISLHDLAALLRSSGTASARSSLYRRAEVPVVFVAFDLLSLDRRDLRPKPYLERRQILEQLGLAGPQWRVPETFDDGRALWEAVASTSLKAWSQSACTSLTPAETVAGSR